MVALPPIPERGGAAVAPALPAGVAVAVPSRGTARCKARRPRRRHWRTWWRRPSRSRRVVSVGHRLLLVGDRRAGRGPVQLEDRNDVVLVQQADEQSDRHPVTSRPACRCPASRYSLSGTRTTLAFQVAMARDCREPPGAVEHGSTLDAHVFAARAIDAAEGDRRAGVVFQVTAHGVQSVDLRTDRRDRNRVEVVAAATGRQWAEQQAQAHQQ